MLQIDSQRKIGYKKSFTKKEGEDFNQTINNKAENHNEVIHSEDAEEDNKYEIIKIARSEKSSNSSR